MTFKPGDFIECIRSVEDKKRLLVERGKLYVVETAGLNAENHPCGCKPASSCSMPGITLQKPKLADKSWFCISCFRHVYSRRKSLLKEIAGPVSGMITDRNGNN